MLMVMTVRRPELRTGKSRVWFQPSNVISILLLSILNLCISVKSAELGHANASPSSYPLTTPESTEDGVRFQVGIIADMDKSSVSKNESNTWLSTYMTGSLNWNKAKNEFSVNWDQDSKKVLKTRYSFAGRGLELSELVTYKNNLITFDDKSGLVYVLTNNNFYPWIVLADGNGTVNQGFKSEWATLKDGVLYVGSTGLRHKSKTGEFDDTQMWVKKISKNGVVESLNWTSNYITIKSALGVDEAGYVVHEAACWSDHHNKWFFLPRKLSKEAFDSKTDTFKGTNVLIACDDNFTGCSVTNVGEVVPSHGFSSFKFVPDTKDELIIAIKTYEDKDKVESYFTAFKTDGTVLLEETKIDDEKYEGFEFV